MTYLSKYIVPAGIQFVHLRTMLFESAVTMTVANCWRERRERVLDIDVNEANRVTRDQCQGKGLSAILGIMSWGHHHYSPTVQIKLNYLH